jgi:hypothetical protein
MDRDEMDFGRSDLKYNPLINVYSKKEFDRRVKQVFDVIWDKLVMSFGPAGAGTFIVIPSSTQSTFFNTKDGYTIMKNLQFNTKIDHTIKNMMSTICDRLNFTVGDGTTTAVVATGGVYNAYMEKKKNEDSELNRVLPRKIMSMMNTVKADIIEELNKHAVSIQSDNPKTLADNIRKVVYVSSNGNEEITEMISDLYQKLQYPAISVANSKDGATHAYTVDGYKIDVSLTDQTYINNDDNTMVSGAMDYIVFDNKVDQQMYDKILKPLCEASKERGRKLACIAPWYDDVALGGPIRRDLLNELKQTGSISLVLLVCNKTNAYSRTILSDFAMLLNTPIITRVVKDQIIEALDKNPDIYSQFDLDNRGIQGANIAVISGEKNGQTQLRLAQYDKATTPEQLIFNSKAKNLIRVGYCDKATIGLKESTFAGFYYDPETYNKTMSVAKQELSDEKAKLKMIGSFSLGVVEKQQRINALGLKTGVIEVGAASQMSQGYLKDSVDDAVKAAASAFNNGVVLGCNCSLIDSILNLIDKEPVELSDDQKLYYEILDMLYEGYATVYRTILESIYPEDAKVNITQYFKDASYAKNHGTSHIIMYFDKKTHRTVSANRRQVDKVVKLLNSDASDTSDRLVPLDWFVMEYSRKTNSVLDVTTGEFTEDVINSTETDREVLNATVDLLSLLITGNQLVLC